MDWYSKEMFTLKFKLSCLEYRKQLQEFYSKLPEFLKPSCKKKIYKKFWKMLETTDKVPEESFEPKTELFPGNEEFHEEEEDESSRRPKKTKKIKRKKQEEPDFNDQDAAGYSGYPQEEDDNVAPVDEQEIPRKKKKKRHRDDHGELYLDKKNISPEAIQQLASNQAKKSYKHGGEIAGFDFVPEKIEAIIAFDFSTWNIPQIKPKYTKSVAPKPVQRKSYGQSPSIRRRSITTTSAKPPVLKPSAVPSKSQKANDFKNDEAVVKEKSEGKETGGEDGKTSEDDTEKPPILEEIKAEPDDDGDEELEEVPDPNIEEKSAPGSNEISDAEKMEVDEEYMEEDEDFDKKPDLEDLDSEVARYTKKKLRETPDRKKGSNNGGKEEEALDEEPEQPVTYTTRGRRHTLPRRNAEFTGHDNVAFILKSQQRAAGSNPAKNKRFIEKQKSPLKPKPVPKLSSPKNADGSRPECVYKLIGDVQGKEVDDNGCVILWDPIPNVKVNQQQLISVIFRSNGMAYRLTRKLTTLVFEDQVLANTSPFAKHYLGRLPPEPLEAMVEFISSSGFDTHYTKIKIYMVVWQVCNEASAGRVRKFLPSASSGSAAATESEAPLATDSTSSTAPS